MIELDIENSYVLVITPYNPEVIKAIKESFARAIWNPTKKAWLIPLEHNNFEDIQQKLLIFSPKLSVRASLFVKKTQEKKERYIKALELFNQIYAVSQLKEFQKDGIRQAIKSGSFLIADSMGLGKSASAIHIAESRGRVFDEKILIVCPNSLKLQWRQEIEKWLPEVADEIQIIKKKKKKRIEQWNNRKKWSMVSYETLRNDKPNLQNYFIIGDEASKCKSAKSQLYLAMERAKKEANDVLLLTGTPLENSLIDFYNILNIVKPAWMTKNKFYAEHCSWDFIEVNGRDFRKIVGFKGVEEFRQEASPYFIRRKKEEVTDLLPKNYEVRYVPFTKEQDSIEYQLKSLVKEINDPNNAFGLLQMLRMNASDPRSLKESSSEIAQSLVVSGKSNKPDELRDICSECDSKVICFTQFARTANILHKELEDIPHTFITGDTKDKEQIASNFKSNDHKLLITTDTLAYGFSCDEADVLVNYDLCWGLGKMMQREDRVHRISSTRQKSIISLVSGDVEEYVYSVLEKKRRLYEKVVDGKIDFDYEVINFIKTKVK